MKVVSLNIWGGLAGKEKLLAFFRKHEDVDIFCLQEVWSAPHALPPDTMVGGKRFGDLDLMTDSMQKISESLPDHNPFFRPQYRDNFGLMMLVKKDLEIITEGEFFVHKEKGYGGQGDIGLHARNVQFVNVVTKNGNRSVLNFHGLWNGKGKGDSDERLIQSDKIIQFTKTLPDPLVLCGDFNLLPETESLKKLGDSGLRDLIKEYGITSTRTSFYTKPEKFADYAFASPKIKVHDFKVLPDEVSDHSALYLEFE